MITRVKFARRFFIWLCNNDIHGGRRVDWGYQQECRRCAKERWNGMGRPGADASRWW